MVNEINIWLNSNPHKSKKQAKPYSDAILQQLLQNALNTSRTVEIKKNKNGKPYINAPIYFSHSNCRQLHAYVLSTECEVGIDVEYINKKRPFMKLAERYFHKDEYQTMKNLPAEKRTAMFFKQWTHKEAWCKLDGGNLWTYLNKMPAKQSAIYVAETALVDGYAVAIASANRIDKIRINSIGNT